MAHLERTQVPMPGEGRTFSPATRLRKHSDFERVYGKGRRLFSAHLTFFFLSRAASTGESEDESGMPAHSVRIGFTVPRAFGTAVERNRVRRQMREAVRLDGVYAPSNLDIVIHPKKSALAADFFELRKEVARALDKMNSELARESRAGGNENR